uniref:CRISPR-associated endoribonuclease Cas2 n=1 Tax=Schlesneria paludicola TaxID=360056 RepID=A0A7C2K179_9PLAN
MRRCFLVCYDIRDPKRLRQVHKICKGYGESWQYSIFFCILKAIDRVRLQTELEEVMNLREDQVLLIDLGPDEPTARANAVSLGQPMGEVLEGMVVL